MKRLILLVGFLIIPLSAFTSPDVKHTVESQTNSSLLTNIEDGWYEATVKYFNYSTGTRSTYTLNVKVEYNRVTMIDFGNGGSVHSGYNSSGYIYSGGNLSFTRDYDYNVVGANTTVRISLENGNTITYNVDIG